MKRKGIDHQTNNKKRKRNDVDGGKDSETTIVACDFITSLSPVITHFVSFLLPRDVRNLSHCDRSTMSEMKDYKIFKFNREYSLEVYKLLKRHSQLKNNRKIKQNLLYSLSSLVHESTCSMKLRERFRLKFKASEQINDLSFLSGIHSLDLRGCE